MLSATMATPAQTDGALLLLWLRLLGWEVETAHDGRLAVGIASHLHDDGRTLRVGGCAPSDGELALQLFEHALRALDHTRHREQQPTAA
jgi:hypothetical protein